jgi:hypothetical protein
MEVSWLVGGGAALVCGVLCYWVWRARRASRARDSLGGYVIGDQIAGGTGAHHGHHHYDSGGGWGDSGGSDGGGNA